MAGIYTTNGQSFVSTAFIRNRGYSSDMTRNYDEGWPDYLTNNPPPVQLFIRLWNSKKELSALRFLDKRI